MTLRLSTRGRARPSTPIAVATPDSIAAARAEVERLHRAELSLADRRAALTAELGVAEADAGDAALSAALDGGDTATAIGRVTALRAEIEATDRAIEAARRQRREAIPAVWHAETVPLRERAAELRREADERQAKTDDLLRQLEAHEGVAYAPASTAQSDVRVDAATRLGGAFTVVAIPTAQTQLLRLEADQLIQQAAALEQRTVQDRGALTDVGSADELIARVRTWDAMTIAPPLPAVMVWATEVETAQRARIARQPSHLQDRLSVRLTFIWTDGDVIDTARSGGRVVGLDH